MKPITVWLPDGVICAFVNYVYYAGEGMLMGSRSIDSDALKSGESKVEDEE